MIGVDAALAIVDTAYCIDPLEDDIQLFVVVAKRGIMRLEVSRSAEGCNCCCSMLAVDSLPQHLRPNASKPSRIAASSLFAFSEASQFSDA